jgi:hypothetical protein
VSEKAGSALRKIKVKRSPGLTRSRRLIALLIDVAVTCLSLSIHETPESKRRRAGAKKKDWSDQEECGGLESGKTSKTHDSFRNKTLEKIRRARAKTKSNKLGLPFGAKIQEVGVGGAELSLLKTSRSSLTPTGAA